MHPYGLLTYDGRWGLAIVKRAVIRMQHYFFRLVGGLLGSFGIEPTLHGINVRAPPARAMEGAAWSFEHLGQPLTVAVRNGTVHFGQRLTAAR